MSTVRFASVVEKCGEPGTYLPLTDPAKDRQFQAAVKAQRVMTVVQQTAAKERTDRGEVGFLAGRNRQFLVFPRSLRAFAGREIVGIKYDLLASSEAPEGESAPSPVKVKAKLKPKARPPSPPKRWHPEPTKVIAFKAEGAEEDDDATADLKKKVKRAMALLEEGKAVAAFNLLKRAVE